MYDVNRHLSTVDGVATVASNRDIHIRNELAKMSTNICLWVLGQCKIMIFKIVPRCPFEGSQNSKAQTTKSAQST